MSSINKKVNPYKFLNRRRICSNTKFNVYFDHLISPNQIEIKDFLIIKPRILKENKVVGICVLPVFNNRFGLMAGWRHQFNEIIYQAPAGFIEEQEQPEETAIRELKEETSLICNIKDLISLGYYLPDAGLIEGRVALFLALNCNKISNKNLDKEIGTGNIDFFTKEELGELIKSSSNIGGSTLVACFRAIERLD
tara:strand:+ start:250 stop:834 length:585 start_codon:yes stop_codon:yes gene_type:complete